MDVEKSYPVKHFNFLTQKYGDLLNFLVYIQKWLLDNIETHIKNVDPIIISNFQYQYNNIKNKVPKSNLLAKIEKNQNKTSIEKMSLAGVGNAAAGNLIADGVKHIITSYQNLPATKGD